MMSTIGQIVANEYADKSNAEKVEFYCKKILAGESYPVPKTDMRFVAALQNLEHEAWSRGVAFGFYTRIADSIVKKELHHD